jgi:hypothetical protein
MDARPYTLTGDPGIEAAVRTLLTRVTDRVAAALAPDAILLSGSFARGEGGAFLDRGSLRLTSDLDLTVVYRGPVSLFRSLRARAGCKALAAVLQRECSGARVDLVTRPELLLTWMASTLDTYQFLRSARTLQGSVRLPPPAAVRLDDIPPDEMRRLLERRGAVLWASWAKLQPDTAPLTEDTARAVLQNIDKTVLACGDAWLFRMGRYDHRLAVRVDRLRLPGRPRAGPPRHFQDLYERAARERLRPDAEVPVSRSVLRERWREAAAEWMATVESYDRWQTDPERHPAAVVRRAGLVRTAFRTLRRMSRGLPTEAQLRRSVSGALHRPAGGATGGPTDLTPGSLELSAPAHRG